MKRKTFDELFFSHDELQLSLNFFHKKRAADLKGAAKEDEISYADFCRRAPEYLTLILQAIRAHTFEFEPAKKQEIYVDKARVISKFSWQDRFLLTHFARVLHEWMMPHYPDTLFSYRPGYSSTMALGKLASYVKSAGSPLFALRRDVSKFGDSMQHAFIIKEFREITGASSDLCRLLEKCCRYPFLDDGRVASNMRGLPTGNFIQVVFENIYLLPLDHKINAIPGVLYFRFGDDILAIGKSEEDMRHVATMISMEVEGRGLQLNHEKSGNIRLVKSHEIPRFKGEAFWSAAESFSYLGMEIRSGGGIATPARKVRRARQFIRKRLVCVARLLPAEMSRDARVATLVVAAKGVLTDRRILSENASRTALAEVLDSSQLVEFDRWLELLILKLAKVGTFRRKTWRQYNPRKLRDMGLPSLIHLRRIGEL